MVGQDGKLQGDGGAVTEAQLAKLREEGARPKEGERSVAQHGAARRGAALWGWVSGCGSGAGGRSDASM